MRAFVVTLLMFLPLFSHAYVLCGATDAYDESKFQVNFKVSQVGMSSTLTADVFKQGGGEGILYCDVSGATIFCHPRTDAATGRIKDTTMKYVLEGSILPNHLPGTLKLFDTNSGTKQLVQDSFVCASVW